MSYLRSLSPMSKDGRAQARSCLSFTFAAFFMLFLFTWFPLPKRLDDTRDATSSPSAATESSLPSSAPKKSKYAFATFLAADTQHPEDTDGSLDNYFIATRVLTYQLLHAEETRSDGIPFVVLVTPEVTEAKRARLRNDGAIVHEVAPLKPDGSEWLHIDIIAWQDVMSKLRLWELTQYELIAFFDADTILTRPVHGVFDDPAVALQHTRDDPAALDLREGDPPSTYVLASNPEMLVKHHYPPSVEGHDYPNNDYFNAGFFVIKPDNAMLDLYATFMQTPESFDPRMPEQNLLNIVHRPGGNMPWTRIDVSWNIHFPTKEDLEGGVASLHEKFWIKGAGDLMPYLQSWRWRMEGFWEGREGKRWSMNQEGENIEKAT